MINTSNHRITVIATLYVVISVSIIVSVDIFHIRASKTRLIVIEFHFSMIY